MWSHSAALGSWNEPRRAIQRVGLPAKRASPFRCRWIKVDVAMLMAKRAINASQFCAGDTRAPRIITDALDVAVFEWPCGEGITWPKQGGHRR